MSSGSPPTLWCDLIFAATPSVAARLDHVRVERPLHEEADVAELRASSSKTRMNSSPIELPLLLRIVDALEPREEPLLRLHVHERHVEVAAERLDDLLRLVRAQKPWSTKTHVSWSPTALWTSSAATAESTPPERPQMTRSRADLGADPLDLLLDHGGGRPRGRRAGDVVEEVLEQVLAVRRVHDLGWNWTP